MTQRGRFLYPDQKGIICISFERGGKGVPVESLLPDPGRGDGFEAFRIKDYFDLADLVLAAPDEWTQFGQETNKLRLRPDETVKVHPPAPNLDYLKLRGEDGNIQPDRTAELFTIVAAYWLSNGNLGLEPGLVAQTWRKGMKPDWILAFIRQHTKPDGKLSVPKPDEVVATTQKRLRKKRKQGRVNRKRGRR